MENTNEMQVTFDSRSSNEAFARVTVAAFMTSLNPTVEEVSDVKTAVSEAVTNAIIHGYENEIHKITIRCRTEGKTFDTIVLDPPAFCKSAAEVKDAFRGYKDINISAMRIVKKGGFLITCSCSHYMTLPLFEKMLRESAQNCGRQVKVLETRVQAPDHPALLAAEETSYLKVFVLQVE